jgi:pyrroloquinoline quinone (PQQ) biosynthesis protein C
VSNYEKILSEWTDQANDLNNSSWFTKFKNGQLDVRHYKGYLHETYHHTGINPQIQAFSTLYFKGNPRDMVSLFFNHANSEIGHDLLALNDLKELGVNPDSIVNSRPLPTTMALNAFVIYVIQFLNPVGYLGYLFHLEFLPTQSGKNYLTYLKSMGVKDSALGFLKEHANIDVAHNNMMKKYLEKLVHTQRDLDDLIHVARSTCVLHQKMMEGAFELGEKIY